MPQPRKHSDHAARQAAYRARSEKARQGALAAKGLPSLPAIATLPGWARWNAALKSALCLLEQVCEEMQAYYDERSQAWQESERAETFAERQEAIATLVGELEPLLL